jgi:hypothetical protein
MTTDEADRKTVNIPGMTGLDYPVECMSDSDLQGILLATVIGGGLMIVAGTLA